MDKIRKVKKAWQCRPTIEGAGVRLCRAFGYDEVPRLDPFLMLDDFHSENPGDYVKGFPWHPHRGIETVTYMIRGAVKHGDSLGNSGRINSGDVQWMTAGSGIIHQEMPQKYDGMFQGFQLWVNLPKSRKMMEPRYREVKADAIEPVEMKKGVFAKVIAGEIAGKKGPVRDLVVDCQYYDVEIRGGAGLHYPITNGHNAFAYIYDGEAVFDGSGPVGARTVVHLEERGALRVTASQGGVKFLLVSGRPIREPVAWRGPIVMNTEKELDIAFDEFAKGTFIKPSDGCRRIEQKDGCKYYVR